MAALGKAAPFCADFGSLFNSFWAPHAIFDPFWLHVGSLFDDFSAYCSASFLDRFLKRICSEFGCILEVFFIKILYDLCCFC